MRAYARGRAREGVAPRARRERGSVLSILLASVSPLSSPRPRPLAPPLREMLYTATSSKNDALCRHKRTTHTRHRAQCTEVQAQESGAILYTLVRFLTQARAPPMQSVRRATDNILHMHACARRARLAAVATPLSPPASASIERTHGHRSTREEEALRVTSELSEQVQGEQLQLLAPRSTRHGGRAASQHTQSWSGPPASVDRNPRAGGSTGRASHARTHTLARSASPARRRAASRRTLAQRGAQRQVCAIVMKKRMSRRASARVSCVIPGRKGDQHTT